MRLLLTRPRRIAVALFAFGGTVVGVPALINSASANEPCTRVKVWTYHSNEGRRTQFNDCGPAPWDPHTTVTVGREGDNVGPDGTPTGAGVEVWIVP